LAPIQVGWGASVGAYDVVTSDTYVGCAAKCSCGVSSYTYAHAYFVNECPHCGGKLYFEQGPASYTSPES
jgi:hypothetical protein